MILSRDKKLYIIFALIFILLLSFALPTFARYKNRISSYSNVWNGNVASHYKSGDGTSNSPYIISNGEELAYFSSQLENNNYEGVYFKLSNDILLNECIFKYENDLVEYVIGNNTYYGKMVGELSEKSEPSPLKERLNGLAMVISKIGYVCSGLVSVSYLFSKIFTYLLC